MIVLIPFERAVFTSMHDCKHVSANAVVDYPFVTRSGRLKQKKQRAQAQDGLFRHSVLSLINIAVNLL